MQCLAASGKLLARSQPRLAAQISFRAHLKVTPAAFSEVAKVGRAGLLPAGPQSV
jgi:hypothetical protein